MEAPAPPPPPDMAPYATDMPTQAHVAMEAPAPPPPSIMAHGAMGTPAQTPMSNINNAADPPADAPADASALPQEATVPHIFAPLPPGVSRAAVATQPARPSHDNHAPRRNGYSRCSCVAALALLALPVNPAPAYLGQPAHGPGASFLARAPRGRASAPPLAPGNPTSTSGTDLMVPVGQMAHPPGNPTSTSGIGLMAPVGQVAHPSGASPPFMGRDIQTEPSSEPNDSWFSARPTWPLLAWLLVLSCAVAHSDGLPSPSFFTLGVMLCITLCTLTNLPDSPTPTTGNALRLSPRGLRYPAPSRAPSVPLRKLLWPALHCSLARTARATTPSDGTAHNAPDCAHGLPTVISSDLSDDSDASTQIGDHNGDGDVDVSLNSHTSSHLPDDQSIDSMLDSVTSDEAGVVSVEQLTESDTSTMSLPANDDDGGQHHPDDMNDHGDATSTMHHTATANHHHDGAPTTLTATVQDADSGSGSGSGGGTHLAPVPLLGHPDYNDTHFPHPDDAYRRSEANTAAVALTPPHDRMCSTNNCKRFSRFSFTDFEWPACCTLCYSQGSSSHSSTCDASQGTCTTRGCQRRLNSDPLVGWHPVGERFCCVDCINTAGARHSAACDETFQSRNDIEPSASRANAPSWQTTTLTLTLVLSPLPLVPRILGSHAHHIRYPDTRSTWHTFTTQPRRLARAVCSLSTCAGTHNLDISDSVRCR